MIGLVVRREMLQNSPALPAPIPIPAPPLTLSAAAVMNTSPQAKALNPLPCAGAVFPALFGAVVYPLTGLNPDPVRFLRFLGIITLESFTSRCVCGLYCAQLHHAVLCCAALPCTARLLQGSKGGWASVGVGGSNWPGLV